MDLTGRTSLGLSSCQSSHQNHPKGLLKQSAGPHPRISDRDGPTWCTSNKALLLLLVWGPCFENH